MKRSEEMTFWERIYLPEILRGLAITNYHFVRNLFCILRICLGSRKTSTLLLLLSIRMNENITPIIFAVVIV